MGENSKLDPIKRIHQINDEIKNLERELTEIQSKCQHKYSTIKFDVNQGSYKAYCKNCDKFIRYPSDDELKNFLGNGNN
jgi:hypothetical protein